MFGFGETFNEKTHPLWTPDDSLGDKSKQHKVFVKNRWRTMKENLRISDVNKNNLQINIIKDHHLQMLVVTDD